MPFEATKPMTKSEIRVFTTLQEIASRAAGRTDVPKHNLRALARRWGKSKRGR